VGEVIEGDVPEPGLKAVVEETMFGGAVPVLIDGGGTASIAKLPDTASVSTALI
jgi:hypothetical protein